MHKLLISIRPWKPTVVTHSGLSAGQRAAPADRTGSGAASGPITQPDLSRQAESDTAAGRDGVHIINGTWPVQLYVPAGNDAAADLAGGLSRSNEGWHAETGGDGWVTVIPAVPHE